MRHPGRQPYQHGNCYQAKEQAGGDGLPTAATRGLGCGCGCRCRNRTIELHPKNPDRLGYVFDRLRTQVLEGEVKLAFDLADSIVSNANAAGLCQAFQARRNIDAITIKIVALDDYVTNIDADAEL